jgi:hypothetical protein
MPTPEERVAALVLRMLHDKNGGWLEEFPPPQHLAACPDAQVLATETHGEEWFDTGVDATRFTASLSCPHQTEPIEWEWADLGSLGLLLSEMDV